MTPKKGFATRAFRRVCSGRNWFGYWLMLREIVKRCDRVPT